MEHSLLKERERFKSCLTVHFVRRFLITYSRRPVLAVHNFSTVRFLCQAASQSSGLAWSLRWLGRRLGLKRTGVRDEHADFGKSLQLRLTHSELTKHLSVVLALESRRADRRQFVP